MWPLEWSEFFSWHPRFFRNWLHIAHPGLSSSSFPWNHQAGGFILLFLISTSMASDYSTLPATGLDFLLTLPVEIQVSSSVEVHSHSLIPFLSHSDCALLCSCIDHYNIYSHFILRFSNIPLRAGVRFLNHVGRLAWMCLCVIWRRKSKALFWFFCSLTWVFNWTQSPGDPYTHSCLRRTSLEAGEVPRVLVPVNT